MRQRIMHGQTLDAATPGEVGDIVARAFTQQQRREWERKKGAITLDATGAGSDTLAVSAQYDWLIERISVSAGPGALFAFYENQISGSDMIQVIQLGSYGIYSDAYVNGLWITANTQLIIAVTEGGTGMATYNLQVRLLHQMIPHEAPTFTPGRSIKKIGGVR